jgi:hypothetical protein
MYRTSFISKFGALCIFLPSVIEMFRVAEAYRLSENPDLGVVRNAFLLPLLLAVVFGVRFFLLMTQRMATAVNAFMWILSMSAAYFYSAQMSYFPAFWRDESGFSRGKINPFGDPLLILALLFMFFSMIRFCITALSAFAERGASLNTSR